MQMITQATRIRRRRRTDLWFLLMDETVPIIRKKKRQIDRWWRGKDGTKKEREWLSPDACCHLETRISLTTEKVCVEKYKQEKLTERRRWWWWKEILRKWVCGARTRDEDENESFRNIVLFCFWRPWRFCTNQRKKGRVNRSSMFDFLPSPLLIEHSDSIRMPWWENHSDVCVFPRHLMWHNHEAIHSYVGSSVCLFVMFD